MKKKEKRKLTAYIHLVELVRKKHGTDEGLFGVPVLEVSERGAAGASSK